MLWPELIEKTAQTTGKNDLGTLFHRIMSFCFFNVIQKISTSSEEINFGAHLMDPAGITNLWNTCMQLAFMHLFAACMHWFRHKNRKHQHRKPFSCSPPLHKGPLLWIFCKDSCMQRRTYVRGGYMLPATPESKAHWERWSRGRWHLLIPSFPW